MGPEETVLQFSQGLTEDEYRAVAGLLTDRPDVMLRAFGGYGFTLPDLEFLRFFPDLRRLAVDSLWGVLRSVEGLRHLPDDLVELRIGSLKPPFDLEHIRRFRRLRHLGLEGPLRHPGVISTFVDLETLHVRSVTLDGLETLVPLTSLRRLDLK